MAQKKINCIRYIKFGYSCAFFELENKCIIDNKECEFSNIFKENRKKIHKILGRK